MALNKENPKQPSKGGANKNIRDLTNKVCDRNDEALRKLAKN